MALSLPHFVFLIRSPASYRRNFNLRFLKLSGVFKTSGSLQLLWRTSRARGNSRKMWITSIKWSQLPSVCRKEIGNWSSKAAKRPELASDSNPCFASSTSCCLYLIPQPIPVAPVLSLCSGCSSHSCHVSRSYEPYNMRKK